MADGLGGKTGLGLCGSLRRNMGGALGGEFTGGGGEGAKCGQSRELTLPSPEAAPWKLLELAEVALSVWPLPPPITLGV